MSKCHLAQINIAHSRDTRDSETMKGFMDRLDEINSVADRFPGFVWRLQTEEGDATAIQAFDDPLLLVNVSVWDGLDSLKAFVYKSLHVELIQDRDAWFEKVRQPHQALWWVPEGHLPSVEEGREKLEYLQANGPSEVAFTFAKSFGPPV
ncbi:DUF3291 domain-containing protein [Halioglobus maricola]|uniref:DUF3291 domain-containing protein n=1 Tax=Halioglobus maricola TaxID=2601894 RepID=UPI00197AC85B|nr:DUF3291 domain-containing protein [Halioglobus maricola]